MPHATEDGAFIRCPGDAQGFQPQHRHSCHRRAGPPYGRGLLSEAGRDPGGSAVDRLHRRFRRCCRLHLRAKADDPRSLSVERGSDDLHRLGPSPHGGRQGHVRRHAGHPEGAGRGQRLRKRELPERRQRIIAPLYGIPGGRQVPPGRVQGGRMARRRMVRAGASPSRGRACRRGAAVGHGSRRGRCLFPQGGEEGRVDPTRATICRHVPAGSVAFGKPAGRACGHIPAPLCRTSIPLRQGSCIRGADRRPSTCRGIPLRLSTRCRIPDAWQ